MSGWVAHSCPGAAFVRTAWCWVLLSSCLVPPSYLAARWKSLLGLICWFSAEERKEKFGL